MYLYVYMYNYINYFTLRCQLSWYDPTPKHPMHVKFNLIMYCTPSKTVLAKLYSSKCIENWEFLNCFVT